MSKNINVKKLIKILSWTSVLGVLVLVFLSIYNAVAYLKNLEQVKTVISLLDKDTSTELRDEVLKAVATQIHSSEIVLGSVAVVGLVILVFVVYLGVTIKKETDKRIHAMDWIIE